MSRSVDLTGATANPNAGASGTTGNRRVRFGLDRPMRWAPALLLLGAAVLYLFRLGRVGLYDLDEGVYAEISREMLVLGNWLTPHLDFVPYLEKPPLLFWLNALSFKILGVSEFSARFPTALAAIASVGCVYGIGRDLWGRRGGLAAGAILATSFGFMIFGRMAMPDMLFAALLTAAFWGFERVLLEGNAHRVAAFGAYAAMAGAVLAKGVIGLLFPALAVGAFLSITRDRSALRRLELARGGALFLLIAAPWHVLMAWRNPGFLEFYFVNEHVSRFLGHRQLQNYASLPIGTYLAMILVWFCPWSIFLPAALHRCLPRILASGRAERGTLFVLLWAAGVVSFFALSASRLEYYALPALPALALCVGRLWGQETGAARERRGSRSLGVTWAGLIVFAVLLVPAAYFFPRLEHVRFYNIFPDVSLSGKSVSRGDLAAARIYDVPGFDRLVPLFEVVVVVIITGTAVSAWAWFNRRRRLGLACLVAAVGLGMVVIQNGFLLFEAHRSVVRLASLVNDEIRPGEQILVEGKYELHAGLGFYTRQRIRVYRGLDGVLWYDSRRAASGGTFVTEGQFGQLWQGSERTFLLSDAPDRLAQLRELAPATVVLGRTGNTWLFANRAREGTLAGNN
jgi:hypothetical protein